MKTNDTGWFKNLKRLNEFQNNSSVLKLLLIISILWHPWILSFRELEFRKGETVRVLRGIDENWVEGEHNGYVGIFPISYIEVKVLTDVCDSALTIIF